MTSHLADDVDPDTGRVTDLFGGSRLLHRRIRNRMDAHDFLRDGMPSPAFEHLIDGVGIFRSARQDTLEKAVGISLRTFQRRKEQPHKPLSAEQSGRVWKFAEILARATEAFGSQAEAERWLETPAMALEQRTPLDLLSTPAGVRIIEDYLTRLQYGVYM